MGFLTRAWKQEADSKRSQTIQRGIAGSEWTDSDRKINEKVEEIAQARGTTMAVIAIAYTLAKPFIHSPIIGMSSEKRVDEAIEAINFKLSDEEVKAIDDLYTPHDIIGFS